MGKMNYCKPVVSTNKVVRIRHPQASDNGEW